MNNVEECRRSRLHVECNRLYVLGQPIEGYEIHRKLGQGASGVVYLARNVTLDRLEAIKVWIKLRDGDNRDKVKQGVSEAAKLAKAVVPS
jgi:serine/threonine protein kinase